MRAASRRKLTCNRVKLQDLASCSRQLRLHAIACGELRRTAEKIGDFAESLQGFCVHFRAPAVLPVREVGRTVRLGG